jgi:hypothetical protein
MITLEQCDELQTEFHQYYQHKATATIEDRCAEENWQNITNMIREWELVDGDQERFIGRWRSSRYPFTAQIARDINRAFEVAEIIKKDEQGPRGDLYGRAMRKDKAVGKRRVDLALKVDKLLKEKKPKAAIANIRKLAYDGAFKVLGKIANDYWEQVTIDGEISSWWEEYKKEWHLAYDHVIETRKSTLRASAATKARQEAKKAAKKTGSSGEQNA